MIRNVHGGNSRPSNNVLDTVNAAASLIAYSENRVPQATIQKRRWGSCWNAFWCFGYHKHRKRIAHAVVVPENSTPVNDSSVAENPTTQASPITLPFVAPPSSPASVLHSEPPSASQSPACVLSLSSISASMYSPIGPASIFAIGPYAHETQLVSPPEFSTFTTEPSTAPFTPPPESVHLTTPSSPEVPFAQLLDPRNKNGEVSLGFPWSNYEFESCQFYPGSPVGQLISPRSVISGSGTSSPFRDGDFAAAGSCFLQFPTAVPPKLLNLEKLSVRERGSRQGSGTLTPDSGRVASCSFLLERQCYDVASNTPSHYGTRNDQAADLGASFNPTAKDVIRCVEPNPESPVKAMPESTKNGSAAEREQTTNAIGDNLASCVGATSNDQPEQASTDGEKTPRHQKHRTLTLTSLKEFNFDNPEGGDSHKPNAGPDWWANDSEKEDVMAKNWSFFPVIQSSAD